MPLSFQSAASPIDSYSLDPRIKKKQEVESPPTWTASKHKVVLLNGSGIVLAGMGLYLLKPDLVSCALMAPMLIGLYSQSEAARAQYGALAYVPMGLATLKAARCCFFQSEPSSAATSIFKLALAGIALSTVAAN